MSTRRPYNIPQSEPGSDIAIGANGPNITEVIGILSTPISPTSFVPGTVYYNDGQQNKVTQVRVLPVSTIPYKDDTIISYILNSMVFDPAGTIVYTPDGVITQEY